jgi:hypothetical protein
VGDRSDVDHAPGLGARPRWSLLVALVVLAGAAGVWIRLWRHPLPTPSTVLEVDPPRETGLA